MTCFFNIYIQVDIFIIVFLIPYYYNIRYVVLTFEEIKTHHYLLLVITKYISVLNNLTQFVHVIRSKCSMSNP